MQRALDSAMLAVVLSFCVSPRLHPEVPGVFEFWALATSEARYLRAVMACMQVLTVHACMQALQFVRRAALQDARRLVFLQPVFPHEARGFPRQRGRSGTDTGSDKKGVKGLPLQLWWPHAKAHCGLIADWFR